MILSKFVSIQSYLESTGTMFGYNQYIQLIFDEFLKNDTLSVEKANCILNLKTDNATSIFKMLNYIGVVKSTNNQMNDYKLTKIAHNLFLKKKSIQSLFPLFLNWLPLKIFLKYLEENPESRVSDFVNDLGSQIKDSTKGLSEFFKIRGLRREGVDKPFNDFIVHNLLVELAESFGLIDRVRNRGPFYLTRYGNIIAQRINFSYLFLRKPEINIDLTKLALVVFLCHEFDNVFILAKEERKKDLNKFIELIKTKMDIKKSKIVYQKSKSEIVLTRNAFFRNNSGITY